MQFVQCDSRGQVGLVCAQHTVFSIKRDVDYRREMRAPHTHKHTSGTSYCTRFMDIIMASEQRAVKNPIHPDSLATRRGHAHERHVRAQRVVSQRASRLPFTLGSGGGSPGRDGARSTRSTESPSAGKVNCFGRDADTGKERRCGLGSGTLTERQSPISSHATSIGRSRGFEAADLRGMCSSRTSPSSITDFLSSSAAAARAFASGVVPLVTDEARLSVRARRAACGGDTKTDFIVCVERVSECKWAFDARS